VCSEQWCALHHECSGYTAVGRYPHLYCKMLTVCYIFSYKQIFLHTETLHSQSVHNHHRATTTTSSVPLKAFYTVWHVPSGCGTAHITVSKSIHSATNLTSVSPLTCSPPPLPANTMLHRCGHGLDFQKICVRPWNTLQLCISGEGGAKMQTEKLKLSLLPG
jgi:hypothetical protein